MFKRMFIIVVTFLLAALALPSFAIWLTERIY